MGRWSSRVALAVSAAMILAAGAKPARAQSADDKIAAEALYDQGRKLLAEGKLVDACPKLAESNRLDPGIGTMLYLAECYEKNGQSASAWGQFREAAAVAARQGDKREKIARERATKLEPTLAKLLVTVPPSSELPGLEVQRDGNAMNKVLWGIEVPIDPGPHKVSASAPKKKGWEVTVDIPNMPGAVTVNVPLLVDVADTAPAAASSASSAPDSAPPDDADANASDGRSTRRVLGLVIAGVGVAGVAVGAVFGLDAKSKFDESNASGDCTSDDRCNAAGMALRDDATSKATLGTVFFGVGLAAVAGGTILFVTALGDAKPKAVSNVAITPALGRGGGGVAITGRF